MTSFFKNGYHYIKHTTNYLIDYIFPRNALEKTLQDLTEEDIENIPKSTLDLDNNTHALWDYKNPLIKELIWQIKFYENEHLLHLIAPHIAAFIEYVQHNKPEPYYIVPIPISKRRRETRGFNQTELIIDALLPHLSQREKVYYKPNTLVKIKETKHQTGESRKDRLVNLHNSFHVYEQYHVKDKHVLLVDDVTTTGATFLEATKTLRNAGARSVICISLAH